MGTEVDLQEFSRSDRTRLPGEGPPLPRRLRPDAARVLFDIENPMTGMEIEFNLVDDEGDPR